MGFDDGLNMRDKGEKEGGKDYFQLPRLNSEIQIFTPWLFKNGDIIDHITLY